MEDSFFDLETETYDEVLHPEYDEDYGEKDSWTKLVSIPYPDPLIQPFLDIQESWTRFWKALWMSSDEKIML
ncbi:hypothetical protein Tco_0235586 [Tanacetum coccineum]